LAADSLAVDFLAVVLLVVALRAVPFLTAASAVPPLGWLSSAESAGGVPDGSGGPAGRLAARRRVRGGGLVVVTGTG